MSKFVEFHNYIKELCDLYQKTGNLKNLSIISRKYGVKALTKVQFFQFGLHEVKGEPSREKSDEIRKAMLDEHRKYNHSKKLESKLNIDNIDFPPIISHTAKLEINEHQPWQYAMQLEDNMCNEEAYMLSRFRYNYDVITELNKQLFNDTELVSISQYMAFELPLIQSKLGEMSAEPIACVKCNFTTDTFYLCNSLITLKLLAWIAYFSEEGIYE